MTATTAATRHWHRLRVNGSQAEMAADVTQNEALEGIVTTVADVELETTITLATGLPVDLMYVEQISELMAWQFSGTVNHVAGQSFPNRVVLTCVGPLAHLRRCPTVDHDLTGMTEGEAAKHILTACNVTYDSADIADSGYVLGAQTPVLWLKDQPGHEMLAELDAVFGMATIEVGQGRVVRFAYDKAPDAAAITTTYTRGADVAFWGNQRDKGDFDSIINLVQVRGATWTDSGNKCNYTPWARGSANNADLGGTARNRSQAFQSDLIQDEALATAVATRLMRWGNRQPDTITLVAQNDPTLNCGAVIGVKDAAYGIGLSGDATATPYLVLTIDRRGNEMTLGCVGGSAGVTGTITHGVEKVCNKTSSNFPIPGLFTPPALGYPPLLDWLPYASATDGAPGDADRSGPEPGGDTAGCVTPDSSNWHEVTGSLSYGAGELSLDDLSGHPEAHFVRDPGDLSGTGTAVNAPTIVRIAAHVAISGAGTAGDAPIISIQMQERAGAMNFAAFQAEAHPDAGTGFFYLYGFGGDFHQTEVTLADLTDGYDVALTFDPVNNLLSMDVNDGTWTASVVLGDWTDAEIGILGAAGSALSCDFTNLQVCFDAPLSLHRCGVGDGTNLAGSGWWTLSPEWTVDPDTGWMTATGTSAEAVFGGIAMTTADSWEVEMVYQALFNADTTNDNGIELVVGASSSDLRRQLGYVDYNQSPFAASQQESVGNNADMSVANVFGTSAPYPIGVDQTMTLAYDAASQTLTMTGPDGSHAVSTAGAWEASGEPVYFGIHVPFHSAITKSLILVKSFTVLSASEGVVCS